MPYPAFVCEYRTLCLRGAVQKAERRTDWCQVHGLTLQLQQRPQGLFSSVLGFLFTPHVSPLGRDRQEKDGLNWHSPCLRWHFFPLPPFWHVSNNLHMRSNLLLPWCTNYRENALTRGENTHGFSASCREHCPQPFCMLLTLKELFVVLLISVSHLMTVFHKENDLVLECLSWVGFDRNA